VVVDLVSELAGEVQEACWLDGFGEYGHCDDDDDDDDGDVVWLCAADVG
jgi:hypothetical protein